eukprot:2120535-Pyramimonas_sp.AAC.1
MIEATWDSRSGQMVFLALDWAKAFDSVSPEGLLQALRQFGVPTQFSECVRAIYTNRSFRVREAGAVSESWTQ